MSLFRCPICASPLLREEKTYRCEKNHSYDLSKEGYTHLLPPNRKHSAAPGDDKGMAAARREFLSKDYYRPLKEALCALALTHTGDSPALLDTGCGEGYYTSAVYRALADAGKTPRMAGTDISKFILRYAAKREKEIEWAVASSYHLPVEDKSIDLLLNCFSPLALEEFQRVLKPGGTFLYVVPAAKHLWELKEVFRRVSLFLEPGGLFLFDVKSRQMFRELGGTSSIQEEDGLFCTRQYGFDSRSGYAQHQVDLFRQEGEGYTRFTEWHHQRAYSVETLTDALARAGMKVKGVYADYTTKKAKEETGRLLFVAQKL